MTVLNGPLAFLVMMGGTMGEAVGGTPTPISLIARDLDPVRADRYAFLHEEAIFRSR